MNLRRVGQAVALCALLAACAKPPPPPPPPAPEPAATPPQTTDGEYLGTSTRFQADNRRCPHPGLVQLDVAGNAFEYHWDYQTYVDATIAQDGAVTGSADRITLTGRQTPGKIEFDVTDGDCGLHVTATKRGP